jgi:NAD(P)H-hydrate epimerase
MTVGGTGDVLAGLCAGFISQCNNLFESAYLASKINKKIGDKLNKKIGIGFIASDFLTEISKEANKYR